MKASVRITALTLPLLALAGCNVEEDLRFGWPRGITEQATQMRELWTWATVAALAVGVLVWGLIFWCIVAYRKRGEELPRQVRFNAPIEVLYTVVPVLIVCVLFYYTAVTQNYVTKQAENPDVTVQVVGKKWNWTFEYPEAKDAEGDAVSTVGTTAEIPILVVPTEKVVQFDLRAVDVIHSFWVPAVLFKRDVIPGRHGSFNVTIEKTGAYVGRCAELCGTYHANMNFEMRAVTWKEYVQYLEQRKSGKTTSEALIAIGQDGYATTTHPFNPDRTARQES